MPGTQRVPCAEKIGAGEFAGSSLEVLKRESIGRTQVAVGSQIAGLAAQRELGATG